MKVTMIVAALWLAAPALAGGNDCDNAMDQNTMNRCADAEFRTADAKLNAAYGQLMAVLADDGFKNKLRTAQRAWLQFRDSECTFETADNEGGSIHPLVYSGCLKRLTEERTKALQAQRTCWQDAEKCGM